MTRVAFLTAHLSSVAGGFKGAVTGMARATTERTALDGHLVGVVDPREPDGWNAWRNARVTVHALRQRGPLAFGYAPAMAQTLRELAPDLVHAQGLWMYPSLANLNWHRRTARPYLIAAHGMLDSWALRRANAKKQLVARWFEREHLGRAACLHALTVAEAKAMRAFGLRNPICVVPNGVDLPDQASLVREPRQGHVLLFLGRLDAKKGVLELVHAWALVRAEAERLGWTLRIVGWGDPAYVASVQRLIAEKDLIRTVILEGPAFGQAKASAFLGADAFVLPSRSEGLPMAVLEAWSYTLPVLMTPACNLQEGIRSGGAIEVEPEPQALADSLAELFRLPANDRQSIGRIGRKVAERHFDWQSIGVAMGQVYDWLLHGRTMPECVMLD
jgi:poly(glycerol-phosphate) alpha-glucosyltransferase